MALSIQQIVDNAGPEGLLRLLDTIQRKKAADRTENDERLLALVLDELEGVRPGRKPGQKQPEPQVSPRTSQRSPLAARDLGGDRFAEATGGQPLSAEFVAGMRDEDILDVLGANPPDRDRVLLGAELIKRREGVLPPDRPSLVPRGQAGVEAARQAATFDSTGGELRDRFRESPVGRALNTEIAIPLTPAPLIDAATTVANPRRSMEAERASPFAVGLPASGNAPIRRPGAGAVAAGAGRGGVTGVAAANPSGGSLNALRPSGGINRESTVSLGADLARIGVNQAPAPDEVFVDAVSGRAAMGSQASKERLRAFVSRAAIGGRISREEGAMALESIDTTGTIPPDIIEKLGEPGRVTPVQLGGRTPTEIALNLDADIASDRTRRIANTVLRRLIQEIRIMDPAKANASRSIIMRQAQQIANVAGRSFAADLQDLGVEDEGRIGGLRQRVMDEVIKAFPAPTPQIAPAGATVFDVQQDARTGAVTAATLAGGAGTKQLTVTEQNTILQAVADAAENDPGFKMAVTMSAFNDLPETATSADVDRVFAEGVARTLGRTSAMSAQIISLMQQNPGMSMPQAMQIASTRAAAPYRGITDPAHFNRLMRSLGAEVRKEFDTGASEDEVLRQALAALAEMLPPDAFANGQLLPAWQEAAEKVVRAEARNVVR